MRMSAGALSLLGDIMPYSNIEPELIFIDSIRSGVATILVRWDIVPTTKQTPDGQEYTEWSYEEARMPWTLPEAYSDVGVVQEYLDSIYQSGDAATGQILSWAKASKVTL